LISGEEVLGIWSMCVTETEKFFPCGTIQSGMTYVTMYKNKKMETPASLIESFWERAEDYSKTTFELFKLKALETTTIVVTSLVSRVSVILVISLFVLIVNIGIAFLLGDLLGKAYYGFFIVALFYLIAAIILHFYLHKWIKKPISDLIINQSLE
jgi:hypothetical protein